MRSERDAGLFAVYQALNARYSSNTTLQWQVPLYVLPVQAALIVGINASEGARALGLGIVGALLGLIAVPMMFRIESVARWDRQALDEFEAVLVSPRDSRLLLMHSARFGDRLKAKPLNMARSRAAKWFERRILRYFPPSRTIGLLLVIVGMSALVMGVLKYADTPEQPVQQEAAHSLLVSGDFVNSRTL